MGDRIGIDVAIVGGGPAGLAAAIALRRRGVGRVVVLEREEAAGGVPRHCAHPPYGIREFGRLMTGPAYAARLVARAVKAGVDLRLRHGVVSLGAGGRIVAAMPDGMVEIDAKRVVLATGARETPRSARLVSGDRPLGVVNTGALQSYIHLKHLTPFSRPVVVGTELVGLSALWTCVRHGIRPVAVVEADRRATARWPLGLFAHLLRVPVHYRSHVADISGSPRVERVVLETPDGRREIACDGVLFTGCFTPEASLMRMGAVAVDRGSGGPSVDQYGRCTDLAYFAAGNLLRPVETAGWCFREGQRLGEAVADDLEGRLPRPIREVEILCGDGIGLCVPQRLSLPGSLHGSIQLRATGAVAGRLTVRGAGRILWSRGIRTRQERRILLPLSALSLPDACRRIRIGVETGSRT